jgi:hypothetical protein
VFHGPFNSLEEKWSQQISEKVIGKLNTHKYNLLEKILETASTDMLN